MSRACRIIEGGQCEITQGFHSGHKGMDIVNKNYTLGWLIAHSAGTVVGVEKNCNYNTYPNGECIYGNYVKIRHDDGYYTLYGHIAYGTVQVSVGQRVSKGQRIGYMGNTGYSNGGHVHWELRTPSDVKINPEAYLNADLPSSSNLVNVFYRVKTKENGWLDEVRNLEDYAGLGENSIIDFMVRVDRGSVWYQAHVKGKGWLPKVTGYNINDYYNGYAGDDINAIDCVRIYYNTPDDIIRSSGYKKAKYRINNLPWVYDNEKCPNGDDFAGNIGEAAYKLEVVIE